MHILYLSKHTHEAFPYFTERDHLPPLLLSKLGSPPHHFNPSLHHLLPYSLADTCKPRHPPSGAAAPPHPSASTRTLYTDQVSPLPFPSPALPALSRPQKRNLPLPLLPPPPKFLCCVFSIIYPKVALTCLSRPK